MYIYLFFVSVQRKNVLHQFNLFLLDAAKVSGVYLLFFGGDGNFGEDESARSTEEVCSSQFYNRP